MYKGTRDEMKNSIKLWLEKLGYNHNPKLSERIRNMCNSRPSYKTIADITLKNIRDHNPNLNSDRAWRYTTSFVNGIKSNLISNNSYFQSVFEDGLFSPFNNKQNEDICLFDIVIYKNNKYNFIKDLSIVNKEYTRLFDFTIIINEFPLLMIELIDKKNLDSFEKAFDRIEDGFDKVPMFFNFNKLILLTDGSEYRLGNLYDFPEEYITFRNQNEDITEYTDHSLKQLEEMLSTKNILKFIKKKKNSRQIYDHIKNNSNKETEKDLKSYINSEEYVIDKTLDQSSCMKKTGCEQKIKDLDNDEELSFLADFFNPDLNEMLQSKEFKKRLIKTKEVPDFKENKAYIEDFQKNKSLDTLETFIKANERLVLKEVNKFVGYETSSMDLEDMYQLGYIGLLKAVERFDLDMENEFSTYAVYWIRQSIIRGIDDESLLIRIPVYRWDSLSKLRKLEYRSEIKFNNIDYDWISKQLDLSKEKIMELVMIRNNFMTNVSLDTPVGIDEDTSLVELIADEEDAVEKIILNRDLKYKLKCALGTLDDKSKDILIKRFGIKDNNPMTLEEIGKIYGVTRERIRQIECKAIRKLRHPSRSKEYKNYCEG